MKQGPVLVVHPYPQTDNRPFLGHCRAKIPTVQPGCRMFVDGLCTRCGSYIPLTSSSFHTMHDSNITGPNNESYADDQPGKDYRKSGHDNSGEM